MNRFLTAALLPLLLASPATAQTSVQAPAAVPAQVATPSAPPPPNAPDSRIVAPLGQIEQIIVAEPTISDAKVGEECRLEVKALQAEIVKVLATEKLPVVNSRSSSEALRGDVFRLTIKPELATLKDGVVSCVSWVGLRAESQHTLRLPPQQGRKTVNVTYWQRGGLVMTPLVDHDMGVINAFQILTRGFAKQWRLDNPESARPDVIENTNKLQGLK